MKTTQHSSVVAAVVATLLSAATAQTSCSVSPSSGVRPSIASGYRYQVVATGLNEPRGLALDSSGRLLVVEQGRGVISAHNLQEENGCVTVESSSDVTTNLSLNHGIEISTDGQTLYGSNPDNAYAWNYDASDASISNQRTLVTNMRGSGHSTRTLLLTRVVDGYLIIPKGSDSNIDIQAASLDTGFSQVKAFNIGNLSASADPYDYQEDGLRLGWGLRNEVGLGEHPTNGDLYGVENSADNQMRMGVDIHQNNPAEEMNYFGRIENNDSPNQGSNFGYPWCFSAWDVDVLPENDGISVGTQYAIDATSASDNENRTDQYCAEQTQASLVFQAHMAPLDIKFNNSGTEAWITFRGSWNREDPIGYKLSLVAFNEDGTPVEQVTSRTAAVDILSNEDLTRCPDNCFRPVAMVIDGQGRIFMSSDASGEIYMITRDLAANGTDGSSPSPSITTGGGAGGGSASSTGAEGAASSSGGAVSNLRSPLHLDSISSLAPMFVLLISVVLGMAVIL